MIGIMATESADNEVEEINFEDISDEVMAVAESIDTAVRDAAAMVRATECLRQAIARKASEPELKQVMEMHRRVRSSLLLRYGESPVTSVLATETSAGGNLVIVREEEANTEAKEGDGFFTKLVDKIIAAFKWLWDKISSVFSDKKEESDKKAVDDAKTSAETLKSLKEVKNEPGTPLAVAAGIVSRIPEAGEVVPFKDFIELVKALTHGSEGAFFASDEISKALDRASLFSDMQKSDLSMERLTELRTELSTSILGILKNKGGFPYNQAIHGSVIGRGSEKYKPEDCFVFNIFRGTGATKAGMAVIGYRDGEFFGKTGDGPVSKEGAKLAAPSAQDANAFGELAEAYLGNLTEQINKRKDLLASIKKTSDSATASLTALKKAGNAGEVQNAALKTVKSIGSLCTAFSGILTDVSAGATLINSIKDAILKTSTEGDKPKEEKPKEEAPAAS